MLGVCSLCIAADLVEKASVVVEAITANPKTRGQSWPTAAFWCFWFKDGFDWHFGARG
jgi:hypothetical protein